MSIQNPFTNISSTLILKPSAPVPTGSDITNLTDGAIIASDLTIRDTSNHYFVIPMAVSGWRSLVFYYQHGSPSWDQLPVVTISSLIKDGSSFLRFSDLAAVTMVANSVITYTFGTNEVSTIGGSAGTSPSAGAGFSHYAIPSLSDGHQYIGVNINFATAPTQGEIARLGFTRMRF